MKKPALDPLRVVVVGNFQVGKSTLVNCLLRRRACACGDSTSPTTEEAASWSIPGQALVLVDTPGINANGEHTWEMRKALENADAALFVLPGTKQPGQTLMQEVVKPLAEKHLPFLIVVNSWDDRAWNEGHPGKVRKEILEAIDAMIRERASPLGTVVANIEWAAAARKLLHDEKRAGKLLEEHSGDADALEESSNIREIERYLNPPPWCMFDPKGLECARFVKRTIKQLSECHAF